MIIKCDQNKGGCGNKYEINEKAVTKDKFIQCPLCSRISPNPLYEE